MFNRNVPTPGPRSRDPIVIDDESEDEDMNVDYPGRQNHPHGIDPRYDPDRMRGPLTSYHTTIEQEKKVRSRLREERHAALCVLMDRELLTMQALAAQETLPQARRRFLSKLIAPEDPEVAASIRSDLFIVQNPSSPAPSNQPLLVHRSVVDVHETDDAGWRRPADAGGSSSAFSSPASSSKNKGRLSTPDRTREKGKASTASSLVSGSAGRGQQLRERERRRRWSGAEREDYGVSSP